MDITGLENFDRTDPRLKYKEAETSFSLDIYCFYFVKFTEVVVKIDYVELQCTFG